MKIVRSTSPSQRRRYFRQLQIVWWLFDLNRGHAIVDTFMEEILHIVSQLARMNRMQRFFSSGQLSQRRITLYWVAVVSLNNRTTRAHSLAFALARPMTPFAAFNVDTPFRCRSLIRILQSSFIFHSMIQNENRNETYRSRSRERKRTNICGLVENFRSRWHYAITVIVDTWHWDRLRSFDWKQRQCLTLKFFQCQLFQGDQTFPAEMLLTGNIPVKQRATVSHRGGLVESQANAHRNVRWRIMFLLV